MQHKTVSLLGQHQLQWYYHKETVHLSTEIYPST